MRTALALLIATLAGLVAGFAPGVVCLVGFREGTFRIRDAPGTTILGVLTALVLVAGAQDLIKRAGGPTTRRISMLVLTAALAPASMYCVAKLDEWLGDRFVSMPAELLVTSAVLGVLALVLFALPARRPASTGD